MPPPTDENPNWAEWHAAYLERVKPLVHISSGEIEGLAFSVEEFAEAVAKELLPGVVQYCSDNGLYLENDDID
jgi:hypothetical protein